MSKVSSTSDLPRLKASHVLSSDLDLDSFSLNGDMTSNVDPLKVKIS